MQKLIAYLKYSFLFSLFCNFSGFSGITIPANVLDYRGTPNNADDRTSLIFSDWGAWFAYSFPDETSSFGGFSGPFLMTQENGKWSSKVLSQLILLDENNTSLNWDKFEHSSTSYSTHLLQTFKNENLSITQLLYFISPHSAVISMEIINKSNSPVSVTPLITGTTFLESLNLKNENGNVVIESKKSPAVGYIKVINGSPISLHVSDSSYSFRFEPIKKGASKTINLSHTFIFPEYDWREEQKRITSTNSNILETYTSKKEDQFNTLIKRLADPWKKDKTYKTLLAKSLLTLQNNWRIPAGELKHSGLFPSYHYVWFHGFWAWDSWKHAVALAQYDTELAKEQVRAMYDFMDDTGFIADCVYRDTTIENHNYRNTKPPLSGWAVWEIYKQDNDLEFLQEMYPKIYKQHLWWYKYRDHDEDALCEYGSTDGTLIAAKWESGMDNGVRFDDSKILKSTENAFSLDQESVDLNAYLYAEKVYLAKIAIELNNEKDAAIFNYTKDILKSKIRGQFYDSESGWYYDTSIDGKNFIKVMGCEGWIPLWSRVASEEQATTMKSFMMNPEYFNTKVPLQTMSAAHSEFKPDGGYWRGPVWLDQSYFGIKGLQNYGFDREADSLTFKIFHNADGLLEKGPSIRENYNPITGAGIEAENFSWSAAHILLLLLKE